VADRLTDRAGDAWKRLTRSRRRRNCKKLAQMARTILKTKDQVHRLAAELAGQAASVAGVRGTALDFTRELVKSIPIVPVDAKLTAAARAIQMAGITLCLMGAFPLEGTVFVWLRCVLPGGGGRLTGPGCFPCAAGFAGQVRLPFRTVLKSD